MARRAGRGVREGSRKFYRRLTEQVCTALRTYLRLEAEAPDGGKVRDHVEKAAAAGNEAARADLANAYIPAAAEHVWVWFWDLRASTPDGFARSPISFQEIDAWIRCANVAPRAWEIRALRAMDAVMHTYFREKKDEAKSG